MSLTKRLLEEELERGFASTDTQVCSSCIGDGTLADVVRETRRSTRCSYCGQLSAAELDDILTHAVTALRFEYRPASEEALPWDGEERRFMAHDFWLPQLVLDHFDDDIASEALREDITDALADSDPWFERDAYALRPHEQMLVSWQRFTRVAMRRRDGDRRPVSAQTRDLEVSIATARMLDTIGEQVAELPDAFRLLPAGTAIWRARPSDATGYGTAADLGAPPAGTAVPAGRMNRAGSIRFYGALDPVTALVERFRGKPRYLSVGRFRTLRPLRVLDLSAERLRMPSIWNTERQAQRVTIRFLAEFAWAISRPVRRSNSPRYIPTQLMTDYVETELGNLVGHPLDGMLFPSSRAPGLNAVFFFGASAGVDLNEPHTPRSRLQLDQAGARVMPFSRMTRLAHRTARQMAGNQQSERRLNQAGRSATSVASATVHR